MSEEKNNQKDIQAEDKKEKKELTDEAMEQVAGGNEATDIIDRLVFGY